MLLARRFPYPVLISLISIMACRQSPQDSQDSTRVPQPGQEDAPGVRVARHIGQEGVAMLGFWTGGRAYATAWRIAAEADFALWTYRKICFKFYW